MSQSVHLHRSCRIVCIGHIKLFHPVTTNSVAPLYLSFTGSSFTEELEDMVNSLKLKDYEVAHQKIKHQKELETLSQKYNIFTK